jgi:hypothetical protein
LLRFDLYENRTLYHNFYEEYYNVKMFATKKPAGHGVRAHRILIKLCQLLGLKDVHVKMEGSMNPKNIIKGFLSGLLNQKKFSDIAQETNLHVVEFKPQMSYYPLVLGRAKTPIQENKMQVQDDKYQRSINTYLFDNRFRLENKPKRPFYYHYASYKKYLKLIHIVGFMETIYIFFSCFKL